jgi:hypothetical protein
VGPRHFGAPNLNSCSLFTGLLRRRLLGNPFAAVRSYTYALGPDQSGEHSPTSVQLFHKILLGLVWIYSQTDDSTPRLVRVLTGAEQSCQEVLSKCRGGSAFGRAFSPEQKLRITGRPGPKGPSPAYSVQAPTRSVPAAITRRRLLPGSFGCSAPLHLLRVRSRLLTRYETEAPNWLYRKVNERGASDKERSATSPTMVQTDETFAAHDPMILAQQRYCVTSEKKAR